MKQTNRTTRDLRRINRSQALRTVYFDGPISRLQASRLTGLSPATVTNVTAELLSEGIIIESGSVDSEVGRPSTLLSINRNYGCFIGIEVREALIRTEVFDLMLSPLDSLSIPLSLIENPPAQVARAIAGGINKLVVQLGFSRKQVIGVGIGMPGIVDSSRGVSVFASHWSWRDVPFQTLLEEDLDFPFFLENGANAMALAEHLFGTAKKEETLLVLSLGNGVGAGIISEGKLFRGASNSAGEWGHTTVDINGPACRCGSHGCLESFVGSAGIIRRWLGGDEDSDGQGHEDMQELIQSILDASREGDPRAAVVVEETLKYLGVGIANMINLFNPSKVIIGGWLGLLLGERDLASLRSVASTFTLPQPRASVSVERSRLGSTAGTLGAAALAMNHFLENAGPDTKVLRQKTLSRRRPAGRLVRVLAVSGLETNVLLRHVAELQARTGITPSIEQVTRPQWAERKNRELLENSGFYDVIMVAGGDDLLWVKRKAHVQMLNRHLKDSDLRQLMHREYFETDGGLFGVPQYYNFPMLYYRKDLLCDPAEQHAFMSRYGRPLLPPRNFDELEQVAEFFHRPPDLYGFFVGGVEWSVFLDYTYFAFGNRTYLGDPETGQLTLNSPEAKRAMGALCRMVRFNPPGWQTLSFFDAERLFRSGKIFMYQNWMYATKILMAAMPEKVGIAPVVGDRQPGEHLGAFVAVIPREAPNPDTAGEFISWMLSPGYQKSQSIETGNLPVRKDVLEDPEVRAALVGFEEYQKALPHLSYQRTTWFSELSVGISEAIWKILGNEMTPDQAMDWLQNEKYRNRKAIE
jgi:multiple sugar transport system substrate-binding protein